MKPHNLRLLALPSKPPATLPRPKDINGVGALLYRRPCRDLNLRLEACRDTGGQVVPIHNLPRRFRKLSGRGIIEGKYGWPRYERTPGFTDWTIYGRTSAHQDSRSDLFILTSDFAAHGQHDLSGTPIQPKVGRTRYGAPLYQLDREAIMLPIYLLSPLKPPNSAHERIEFVDRYEIQRRMILDLLDLDPSTSPEITWLHHRNYL